MTNLIYLIPLLPFLGFVAIVLFTKQNKRLSAILAILLMAVSWIISWAVVLWALGTEHFYEHPSNCRYSPYPRGRLRWSWVLSSTL